MSVYFYMLINVTNVIMKLNVLHYIMLKIFVINDFIHLFYSERFFLQIIVINAKYF